MKARVFGALVLLTAGVALPFAAVSQLGPPWAFRDRVAVVTEVVGTVEFRRPGGEAISEIAHGQALLSSEEVRVGTLSRLTLRTRTGSEIQIADGSRLSFFEDVLSFERGFATIIVHEKPLQVRIAILEADLELGPGRHRLVFDGQERFELKALEGSARASVEGAPWAAGGGNKLLRIGRGENAVWGQPAAALKCSARCIRLGARAAIEGSAQAGAQIFVNGRPSFPGKRGKFSVSLPLSKAENDVVVFGRDASGNFCQANTRCGG